MTGTAVLPPGVIDGSAGSEVGTDVNLPDISASGFAWDTSLFTQHGVIVVVPEPSRVMLLLFGLLGLQHAPPAMATGVSAVRIGAAALSLASTGALMILLKAAHPG